MSGALDIAASYEQSASGIIDNPFPWNDIFEHPEALDGGDRDLFELYRRCQENGTAPSLYQACGTEDFLYKMNQEANSRMKNMGADLIYEEGPGGHNWDFWDKYIQKILDWMLEK